jgi:hypothetical protein
MKQGRPPGKRRCQPHLGVACATLALFVIGWKLHGEPGKTIGGSYRLTLDSGDAVAMPAQLAAVVNEAQRPLTQRVCGQPAIDG